MAVARAGGSGSGGGRGDLDDDGGGVVATGVGHGLGDQALGGVFVGLGGRGGADEFFEGAVPDAVDEAIGAEEETVTGAVADGADVRFEELVTAAEGLLEGAAAGVGAGLAFVDAAVTAEPADVAVVVGDLGEAALFGKVVDAAVADVGEIHPFGGEPGEAEGGAHASAFLVAGAEAGDGAVDGGEEFGEDVVEAAGEAEGGDVEAAGEEAGDFLDGDAAGEFAGFGSAHAIADGEDEIGFGEGGLAGFAEVADLAGVEIEGEEGVFVIGAEAAAVGAAGPAEGGGRGGGEGGRHGRAQKTGGLRLTAGLSRRVAYSKSMMQKRPSDMR